MNHAFDRSRPPSPRNVKDHEPSIPPPRVLLAEDDAEMRAMIGATLRSDGYDVVEAYDGGDLLDWIADAYLVGRPGEAFDLLVADVRMPVCTGLEVLEGMRNARWSTPAILMTAFPDEETREKTRALGAILLDKPFDVDDLRAVAVDMILRRVPGSSRVPPPRPPSGIYELGFEDERRREGANDDDDEPDTLRFVRRPRGEDVT